MSETKPLCVLVATNTTAEKKKASFFGYSKNFLAPNLGSDNGVIVTTKDSSKTYADLLKKFKGKRFHIVMMVISSPKEVQQTQIITRKHKQGKHSVIIPIITQSYVGREYEQAKANGQHIPLEVPHQFWLDDECILELELLANAQVHIEFYDSSNSNQA